MTRQSRNLAILIAAFGLMPTSAATADWLVTREGERIETDGAWQVKGRMVVFTLAGGALSSMRLSEVDLDASRAATEEAAAARDVAPTPAPEPQRQVSRVITTADVGEGVAGAEGAELLVERLRQAHRYKDVALAMGLVNLVDVPEGMRNYIESQFEWMMERRIRDIRFIEISPDEFEEQAIQEETIYEPNVDVAGQIEVDFLPDPDQDKLSLTFQVGTRLGAFFIAAPREVTP